jgi:hypothetical protein
MQKNFNEVRTVRCCCCSMFNGQQLLLLQLLLAVMCTWTPCTVERPWLSSFIPWMEHAKHLFSPCCCSSSFSASVYSASSPAFWSSQLLVPCRQYYCRDSSYGSYCCKTGISTRCCCSYGSYCCTDMHLGYPLGTPAHRPPEQMLCDCFFKQSVFTYSVTNQRRHCSHCTGSMASTWCCNE